MPAPIGSKTGNAPIKQVGHTAGKNYGTDTNAKVKGSNPTRDLRIK